MYAPKNSYGVRVVKVSGPKNFFLELRDLFIQLSHEKAKGNLSPATLDALARVLSWVPHFHASDSKKLPEGGEGAA